VQCGSVGNSHRPAAGGIAVANYNKLADSRDHIMTVDEFKSDVKNGYLINYDGFGYPMKEGTGVDDKIVIQPSNISDIPQDATHIVWFNR
jgi:hypothetical protein